MWKSCVQYRNNICKARMFGLATYPFSSTNSWERFPITLCDWGQAQILNTCFHQYVINKWHTTTALQFRWQQRTRRSKDHTSAKYTHTLKTLSGEWIKGVHYTLEFHRASGWQMLVQAQIHVLVDEFGACNACQDTLSSVQLSLLPPASVVVTQTA